MAKNDQLTKEQLTEFSALFGPPPVLTTENQQHFDKIWEGLLESLRPRDFLEVMLIKQVQAETWRMLRYMRHQSVGIERRFRQSLKFQIERRQEQKARREALARELAERTGRPITEFDRLIHLNDVVESSVSEVDQILERTPTELDHNEALEMGIGFQEQLDRLVNSAVTRRNQALQVLEVYREGLGQYWRRISDEIIDAERSENAARQVEGPPLVPGPGAENPDGSPAEATTPEAAAPPKE